MINWVNGSTKKFFNKNFLFCMFVNVINIKVL